MSTSGGTVTGLAWNPRSIITRCMSKSVTIIDIDATDHNTLKEPEAWDTKRTLPRYERPHGNHHLLNDRRSAWSQMAKYGASFGVAATTLFGASPQEAFAATAKNRALPPLDDRAPDFELPNTQGQTVTLDRLTSSRKWTVLYFYPGAFTSGCTLEARGFQKDMEAYKKLNAQIVGVSVDSVEKNAQFCSTEELDYFMLSDLNGSVSKKYGSALSIPGIGTFSNRQTYIIDPAGRLRWVFLDVESHVGRHSQEVLDKLTELQQQQ